MAMMLALAPPASADGNGAAQISGDGVAYGPTPLPAGLITVCDKTEGLFTLELTAGNLVGCWYTDTIDPDSIHDNPSGTWRERGTETFVGGFYDADGLVGTGTFSTTYHFTGKFDSDGEIFGRCQHPITGGTGVFEGATGRVDFKDVDPANGILEYRGHLKLAG
jgi:hypothetical protein